MSDSTEYVSLECTRSGPYREGDVMENGVEIVTLSENTCELRYPNGTRTINHWKRRAIRYIQADGTEAIPGEFIELEQGSRFQVPWVFWPPYNVLLLLLAFLKRRS